MQYEPADIIIHIQGKGIVVKEKSVVAYQKSDNKIVAFGTEAYGMAGRSTEDLVVESPLRQGFIADFCAAEKLFRWLMIKAIGKKPLLKKPAVAVCVPKGITEVEHKALEDALMIAGAKELFVTELSLEEFLSRKESSGESAKEYGKFKITVGIGQDEPERYLEERVRGILEYDAQEQIPEERVQELFVRHSHQ